MFFTFSAFTKINIVVSVSAAVRISVGANHSPLPNPRLYFHSPAQPNSLFFFLFGSIEV